MFLKIRLRICRLIVIVSILWFLIGIIFLYNYFDSLMDSRWVKNSHEGSQSVFSAYELDSINNQQIEKRLPASEYLQNDMVTWQPAPIVKPNRNLPGEMGKAVHIPVELESEMKENFKLHQFNIMASDRIALNRSLEDVRLEACKTKIYSKYLPTTSIVIVFHNEAWSTLLRTVWSVINRSPKTLLKEIILVDDASLLDHLGKDLEDYVANLPVPVHVYRTGNRSGLIRARLLGAKKAKGKVITFLDAHCECTEGWLEPLLERIAKNRKTVACPIIDVISDNDFEYVSASDMTWGGFNWKLNFRWYRVPKREMDRRNNDRTEPLRTPTMAGGLFAIEKDYFYEIGSYDKGMDIWGGENLEMSFRIWQCGGILEIIPCSRVGHVFRDKSPYTFPGGVSQIIYKNSRRVVEVWMDAWKDFYYAMTPAALSVDVGNITDRLLLRDKLQCKDFRWYLENIYPESHLPLKYFYLGDIRSTTADIRGPHQCIDTMGRKSNEKVGFSSCHNFGGNQVFSYTMEHQIMSDDNCLDASSLHDYVLLIRCHGAGGNQAWTFDRRNQFIKKMNTNYCLEKTVEKNENAIILTECDKLNLNQKWMMDNNFKWQLNG